MEGAEEQRKLVFSDLHNDFYKRKTIFHIFISLSIRFIFIEKGASQEKYSIQVFLI
jgi:hypothetical protein